MKAMTSIAQSIEVVCEEHGLDRDLIIEAMKEAVKAAARKQFKSQDKTGESIEVDWNNEEGMVEISANKTVVAEVENPSTELSIEEAIELTGDDEIEVGDMLLIPLPTEELGRIAAQTAKQILVQKVREAIREKVYDEYVDRIGTLINGVVKRFERGDIIIDLGNNLEAILPRQEQARSETWNQGERVRVVIDDVSKDLRGQQIKVSRTSPELLKRLFEMEVPEIYDDTVIIKSAVREPGDRAKIAVSSNEKDVDPVGACVGMKGSRVQSIIKELRGEKIDIIEWSDEPSVFAANALSPAKVSQVRITDINDRKMEVIVNEDQLSLAIGKRGQNVRLATRLVGWDIDIISEDILKKEITAQMGKMMASGEVVPITALKGVSVAQADSLKEKGVEDVEGLSVMTIDNLVETLDISMDEAKEILSSAQEIVEAKNVQASEDGGEGSEDVSQTKETSDAVIAETSDEETETVAETTAATATGETVEITNSEMEVADTETVVEETATEEIEIPQEADSTEEVETTEEVEEFAQAEESADVETAESASEETIVGEDEGETPFNPGDSVAKAEEETSTIEETLTSEQIETDEQMEEIAEKGQEEEVSQIELDTKVSSEELTEDITEESVVETEAETVEEHKADLGLSTEEE
jgi:N utilization substance protein A